MIFSSFFIDIPNYKRIDCCGKAENHVKFKGDVVGVDYQKIDKWLRSICSLEFIHVVKMRGQKYVALINLNGKNLFTNILILIRTGYVHFNTPEEAKTFLNYMKEIPFELNGSSKNIVKFVENPQNNSLNGKLVLLLM